MADIELVIRISEDSYKATCTGCMLPTDVENVVQGIKNGTPLPKGHGVLKAEKIAMLEELKMEIEEEKTDTKHLHYDDLENAESYNNGIDNSIDVIQTRIDKLKEDKE